MEPVIKSEVRGDDDAVTIENDNFIAEFPASSQGTPSKGDGSLEEVDDSNLQKISDIVIHEIVEWKIDTIADTLKRATRSNDLTAAGPDGDDDKIAANICDIKLFCKIEEAQNSSNNVEDFSEVCETLLTEGESRVGAHESSGIAEISRRPRRRKSCVMCGKEIHCNYDYRERCVERVVKSKNGRNSVKQMECKVCGKLFNSKSSLSRHRRSHSDQRRSDVCGEAFKESKFWHHRKSHSDRVDEKSNCDVCDKTFTKSYLWRHKKTHEGRQSRSDPSSVSCYYCDKTFSQPAMMKRHEYTVHLKERQMKCDACGKIFCNFMSFSRHQREQHSPSKAKTFGCEICGKAFSRNFILVTHVHTMHNQ